MSTIKDVPATDVSANRIAAQSQPKVKLTAAQQKVALLQEQLKTAMAEAQKDFTDAIDTALAALKSAVDIAVANEIDLKPYAAKFDPIADIISPAPSSGTKKTGGEKKERAPRQERTPPTVASLNDADKETIKKIQKAIGTHGQLSTKEIEEKAGVSVATLNQKMYLKIDRFFKPGETRKVAGVKGPALRLTWLPTRSPEIAISPEAKEPDATCIGFFSFTETLTS